MRLIDADEIKKDFAEILEHDYADDYARGFQAALVGVLGYKTISSPPNDPLTLEQLREMDWAPVWDPNLREWGVVDIHGFSGNGCIRYINNWWHPRCLIGRRFYRREPEEETTCES